MLLKRGSAPSPVTVEGGKVCRMWIRERFPASDVVDEDRHSERLPFAMLAIHQSMWPVKSNQTIHQYYVALELIYGDSNMDL